MKVKCRGGTAAEAQRQPSWPPLSWSGTSAPRPTLLLLSLCRQVAKLLPQVGPCSGAAGRPEWTKTLLSEITAQLWRGWGWTARPRAPRWMWPPVPRRLSPERSSHPAEPLVNEGGRINCFSGKHQLVRKLKGSGILFDTALRTSLKEQIENRSRKRMGKPDWGGILVLCVNGNPSGSWQRENSTWEG